MDEKALKKSNSCESPKKMAALFFLLLLLLSFIPFLFIHFDLTPEENIYHDV